MCVIGNLGPVTSIFGCVTAKNVGVTAKFSGVTLCVSANFRGVKNGVSAKSVYREKKRRSNTLRFSENNGDTRKRETNGVIVQLLC